MMQFVRCVGPPRDNTDGSALALVAGSPESGLGPGVSGFFPIALFAEEFLSPRSSRFQKCLSFQFCHGLSTEELALVGSLAMSGSIVSALQTECKVPESATGAARKTVRMTWSDCKPIRDGWYWIRNVHVVGLTVGGVSRLSSDFFVSRFFALHSGRYRQYIPQSQRRTRFL